jgi:hypothetical protein
MLRLPLVALKRERAGIRSACYSFRRRIEAELAERGLGGGVGPASKLHTCLTALRRHLEAEKRLAEADLKIEQWLAVADRSVRWKESVDRALASLGVDKQEAKDVWAELYASKPVNGRGQLGAGAPASDLTGQKGNIRQSPAAAPAGQIPQEEGRGP